MSGGLLRASHEGALRSMIALEVPQFLLSLATAEDDAVEEPSQPTASWGPVCLGGQFQVGATGSIDEPGGGLELQTEVRVRSARRVSRWSMVGGRGLKARC